jgi:hypothetical protein
MRLSLYSMVAALILFTTAYKAHPKPLNNRALSGVATANLEGACRDGLYLGRLHRMQGLPSRPSRGRWSRESDRQLFETGYTRGYNGSQE